MKNPALSILKAPFLLGLSLLSLLSAAPAAGPRRDFSGQYRADRRIQFDTRRENDSLHIYLSFPNAQTLRPGQPLRVVAWPNYESRRPTWQDSVRHLGRRMRQLGSATRVDFSLPVTSLVVGQVLNVQSGGASDEESGEGAWLEITPERLTRTYILSDSVGEPLLRRYVRVGEVFQVHKYGGEQPLTVKQYDPSFSAALPPMTNPATLPPPPRTMPLQDSSSIPSGRRIKLAGQGLYALRIKDDTKPIGLLAESNSFPQLTSAAELIQPLIYLTSSAERQKLYSAPDPKKAVDRFWLDVAGGQQVVARQLIRTY
ncbi:MAG TPA: GWxTD domain-containing protein, partial [Hymenobacter sp.]